MGLALTNSQTNDAKILYLTDGSTWNDGTLPAYSSVTSAILTIYYKDPDNLTGTTPVELDVTSIFTEAASVDDLVFPIVFGSDIALMLTSGINELPDGIWVVEYDIVWASGNASFSSPLEILVDGVIKAEVYRQLATINLKYLASNNYYTKEIDDILLLGSQYFGMIANAYVAQQSEILNILEVLQRLTE